jgi:hypothetical protein
MKNAVEKQDARIKLMSRHVDMTEPGDSFVRGKTDYIEKINFVLLSSLCVFIFAVYPLFSRFGCEMTLFLSVCVYWAEDVQDYDEGGWFSEEENSDWITSHDAM